MRRRLFVLGLWLSGCAPSGDAIPRIVAAERTASPRETAPSGPDSRPAVGAPSPEENLMTVAQVRRFMVTLINRDRASEGLGPVELDEGPPTRAGQGHADDMATHGYLGHWGTDGSVPEQRFTQAGGADMVLENASCFADERPRTLDRSPLVQRRNVEQAEDMFFHERPPNDGHRKNILRAWHKKVGIGVAQPVATAKEIPVPCFAQEFVDAYGSYTPVPQALRVGSTLHVEGTIDAPAAFAGVGIARIDPPRALGVSELNRRRSYPVPAPYQMYWPPGYRTPIPVAVSGGHFRIDLPVSDGGKAGMYEVSVWATVPGSSDLTIVGMRTVLAR